MCVSKRPVDGGDGDDEEDAVDEHEQHGGQVEVQTLDTAQLLPPRPLYCTVLYCTLISCNIAAT